jgi:hypothetical protein
MANINFRVYNQEKGLSKIIHGFNRLDKIEQFGEKSNIE